MTDIDTNLAMQLGTLAIVSLCAGICLGIAFQYRRFNPLLSAAQAEVRHLRGERARWEAEVRAIQKERSEIHAERTAMSDAIREFERLFLRGNHGSRPVRTQILDAGVHRHH